MAKTHFKKLSNPNYIGVWDLPDGKDVVVTIKNIHNDMVPNDKGGKEECTLIDFEEFKKPMIANITNKKMLAKVLESPYIEDWIGHKVILGADKVNAFGDVVDALRFRKRLPKASAGLICEECGKVITPANGMDDTQVAAYTSKKYGKQLCAECARKEAENGIKQG